MSDIILASLDISQMAISCVESHMCSSEDNKCNKLSSYLSEMRGKNKQLILLYEKNSSVDKKTEEICSNVGSLWASIKSVHSMLILNNLIIQYTTAQEDLEIKNDVQLSDDIMNKIKKFNSLLADINAGDSVSNNTYHILLELQESLY